MSDSDNLILKILTDLRAELREKHEETNTRLDEMSSTLLVVQEQLVAARGDITAIRGDIKDLRGDITGVSAELTAVEIRGATRDTELIASSRNLGKMLEDRFELRDRVERIESDVDVLKRKVG